MHVRTLPHRLSGRHAVQVIVPRRRNDRAHGNQRQLILPQYPVGSDPNSGYVDANALDDGEESFLPFDDVDVDVAQSLSQLKVAKTTTQEDQFLAQAAAFKGNQGVFREVAATADLELSVGKPPDPAGANKQESFRGSLVIITEDADGTQRPAGEADRGVRARDESPFEDFGAPAARDQGIAIRLRFLACAQRDDQKCRSDQTFPHAGDFRRRGQASRSPR